MKKQTFYSSPDLSVWQMMTKQLIAVSFDEADGVTNEGFTTDPDQITF